MFLPWFPFPRLRTASSRHQDLYIPPRGIWHTFARRDEDEAYNYGLDREENRFLGEGRVDGVPQLRTGFLSADPSWKTLSFFFSQDSLSYVLDAFFHLFYPRPISRRNNIEWRNFLKLPISQETNRMRIRFTIQIFYIYLRFKKYQTIFHCII